MEILNFKELSFGSAAIKHAVKTALNNNYHELTRVICFKDKNIRQVFITLECGICTISTDLGGIRLCTVHKPNRHCGTGFMLDKDRDKIDMSDIKRACTTTAPDWGKGYSEHVKKYKTIEEMMDNCSLTYKEIK